MTFGAVVRDDEADEGGLLLPSRDVDGGGVAKADRVAHRLADHLDERRSRRRISTDALIIESGSAGPPVVSRVYASAIFDQVGSPSRCRNL